MQILNLTSNIFVQNWKFLGIQQSNTCEFFRGGMQAVLKVINIFSCTCPNHSGVGAIDNLDRFEQVFDTYYIPEALEKIFTDDISMVRPQKMYIFGVLKAFISNFTYYNLY